MRALLAEDDGMIGEAVVSALKDASYAVDWVRDGEAACEALATHAYDIVLLDLGLPSKDGLAVLRLSRSQGRRHAGAGDHGTRCDRRSHPWVWTRGLTTISSSLSTWVSFSLVCALSPGARRDPPTRSSRMAGSTLIPRRTRFPSTARPFD